MPVEVGVREEIDQDLTKINIKTKRGHRSDRRARRELGVAATIRAVMSVEALLLDSLGGLRR